MNNVLPLHVLIAALTHTHAHTHTWHCVSVAANDDGQTITTVSHKHAQSILQLAVSSAALL